MGREELTDPSATRECLLPRLECRTPKSVIGGCCSQGGGAPPPVRAPPNPRQLNPAQAEAEGAGVGLPDPRNHEGSPFPTPRNARIATTTGASGSDAEAGPHDGCDGAGYAAGAQLPHQHRIRDVMGQRCVGAWDLSTGCDRIQERNFSSGGATGPKPLEEVVGRALSGDPVCPFVHMQVRWLNEAGEVREVSAAWRDTAC